ncbi:hypothetical protein [Streptomyces geranii]|uniref:hypothetical protein n=1 Tax=Streptomyces geranii TaxID=2058923 RepID=UPI0013003D36|nr:hypothetical protein [Streptomyces geranii]
MKRKASSARSFARLHRTAFTTASLAAAGALLGATATSASADSGPTEEQLLSQCGVADYCKFTPTSLSQGLGPEHQVGSKIVNCGGTVQRTWGWSETTSQTTNANISASLSSALWEPISVAASAAFGKTFSNTRTDSETYTQTMEPFTQAWTTRATGLQTITGDWELHFGYRFFGHYYWYDKGYQSKVENPDDGYIALHYNSMTDAEIRRHCPGAKPPARGKFSYLRIIRNSPNQVGRLTGWTYVRDRGIHFSDGGSPSR